MAGFVSYVDQFKLQSVFEDKLLKGKGGLFSPLVSVLLAQCLKNDNCI